MENFIHFGLIVTGKGEENNLYKLFNSIEKTGVCTFKVIRRIGQKNPISSKKRLKELKIVGTKKNIPTKDAEEIGLPARFYLSKGKSYYLILIDDLENSRKDIAHEVYNRYREALDRILIKEKYRASVHFLVNMIEAYFFADAEAINRALKLQVPIDDYNSDVELIRHPKGELKKIYKNYNEIKDCEKILDIIKIDKVLSKKDTCAWLRTLFTWCIYVIKKNTYYIMPTPAPFCIDEGIYSIVTGKQLISQIKK